MRPTVYSLFLITVLFFAAQLPAQPQTAPPQAPQAPPAKSSDAMELVKQGEKLNSEGKPAEAMALYQRALEVDPNLYQAQLAMGAALDLQAKYGEAREHLQKAIDTAKGDDAVRPLRAMAVSYAFECNNDKAAEYERRAFDLQYIAKKFADAAGTADELARIYLECRDLDNAFQWYQTGHLTALTKPDIPPAEKDLWEFRWEAALARIAARRQQTDKAQQHLAAAKATLDKNTNPDQVRFYPYLAGYVALYTGDYQTAIANLQKADQKDPFVLVLLAQGYEKSGDKAQAIEYYKKVMSINAHSPTNAFARPLANEKLAAVGR